MIALDRTTHSGTDVGALLDMVERGCRLLMKAGGGPLPEDTHRTQGRTIAKRLKQIRYRMSMGKDLRVIAEEIHLSYPTVRSYYRKIQAQDFPNHAT